MEIRQILVVTIQDPGSLTVGEGLFLGYWGLTLSLIGSQNIPYFG
jgi:hypothetical protein